MKLTDWVMILSVPGVFSLAFVTVAHAGPDIFIKLAPFFLIMFLGLLLQVFVVFPLVLRLLAKIDFVNLYRAVSEAIMVAFGTASSSATLPVTIACCERRAGISNRIASFVLPTGATINKTGTTMFLVIGVIFLLQAYGYSLDVYTVSVVMLVSIIASIGTPAVPSAGLFTMVIVFNSIGISSTEMAAGIGMLWFIDRALDMCRTVVNVISSCTVAALVASSEGELNRDILNNRDAWVEVV
jgi:Na+/H+-dicarboxylate symporter